jgi:hypothetical protein
VQIQGSAREEEDQWSVGVVFRVHFLLFLLSSRVSRGI